MTITCTESSPRHAVSEDVVSRFTHKSEVSHAVLRHLSRTGENRFSAMATQQRHHEFYLNGSLGDDPMLMVEALREAAIWAAHSGYDVPEGSAFVMSGIGLTLDHRAVRLHDCLIEVAARAQRRGAGRVDRFDVDVTFVVAGQVRARGYGITRIVPEAVHRRVRGARPRAVSQQWPALEPELVGREDPSDVVLSSVQSPLAHSWFLRVDTSHRVLFDHELDHVPGMMLLEAARQAAVLRSGSNRTLDIVGLDATFAHYVELDQPVLVETATDPDDEYALSVAIRQGGLLNGTISLVLSDPIGRASQLAGHSMQQSP